MSFQIYILNIYQTQQCKIEQNYFFFKFNYFLKKESIWIEMGFFSDLLKSKWTSFLNILNIFEIVCILNLYLSPTSQMTS